MTSPSPSADLSRLRIDRPDPPPAVRRALARNRAWVLLLRRGSAAPVHPP